MISGIIDLLLLVLYNVGTDKSLWQISLNPGIDSRNICYNFQWKNVKKTIANFIKF